MATKVKQARVELVEVQTTEKDGRRWAVQYFAHTGRRMEPSEAKFKGIAIMATLSTAYEGVSPRLLVGAGFVEEKYTISVGTRCVVTMVTERGSICVATAPYYNNGLVLPASHFTFDGVDTVEVYDA